MENGIAETAITVASWMAVCVLMTLYLPVWQLVVTVLIVLNILLFAALASACKPRFLKLFQVIFDVVWSPVADMYNYYNSVHLTDPPLQGERTHLWEKKIPPWVRRHGFMLSVAAIFSHSSDILVLFICLALMSYSFLSSVEEIYNLDDSQGIDFNFNLENGDLDTKLKIKDSFEDLDLETRIWFCSVHMTLFVLCISYALTCLPLSVLFMTFLFISVSNVNIQNELMVKFRTKYPHALDGLGALAFLGAMLFLDIATTTVLFLWAFYGSDSSILLICGTYCNAFAAVMEFRIRVWLRLRHERFLIQSIRLATREEIGAHNDVCAICLVHMTSARMTVCQHMFHGRCLRLSLKTNTQCPMCKAALLPSLGHGHMVF